MTNNCSLIRETPAISGLTIHKYMKFEFGIRFAVHFSFLSLNRKNYYGEHIFGDSLYIKANL